MRRTALAFCLLVLGFAGMRREFSFQNTQHKALPRPDTGHPVARAIDITVILLLSTFLLTPLLAVVLKSLTPALLKVVRDPAFASALYSSLLISLSAALLALLISLPVAFLYKNLLQARAYRLSTLLELGNTLILVVPPLTLGMGLFLVLRTHFNVFELGLYLVILINGLLAVPFLLRVLQPAVISTAQQVDRLSLSLGIGGWTLLRLIYWPRLRKPVGLALALAATLSLGDMGVIALFGTQDLATLPLLIYRLFGAYRMQEAAVVAMLLCLLCFLLFWMVERIIGGKNPESA